MAVGARAQERVRRIGVLIGAGGDVLQINMDPFLKGLEQRGWRDGGNVRIDSRRGAGNTDSIRKYAAELTALAPDVILTSGTTTMAPLLQASRTIPIVFVNVADPLARALSKAWPGRVATSQALCNSNIV